MFRNLKLEVDTDEETIKLYDLKFKNENRFTRDEEKKLEDKEEDLTKNKYYKIEDKKLKELEKVFKQVKTKIKLNFDMGKLFEHRSKSMTLPEILFDVKIGGTNKITHIVYDEKNFSKLIELEATASFIVLFVEKLNNNDLIFLVYNGENCELLIYRLKQEQKEGKKGYYLSQKILETLEGYQIKYNKQKRSDYFDMFEDEEEYEEKAEPIEYNLYYIKAVSKNRFFCVSNYGFKIYALNENNEYELVLLEPYEKIDFIYEIDTNKFVFGLNIRTVEGSGFCGNAYTCYYKLMLNKIELKNIDKIDNISKQEKSNDYKELENDDKNYNNLDNSKVKGKLKLSFISQSMFTFNHSSKLSFDIPIYFSDFAILKNKFFIIGISHNILVFSMETGKIVKIFHILAENRYYNIDIKNWDSTENDEFILFVNNNVILFKLNEENSSNISLNILNYAYFPNLVIIDDEKYIIKNLKKINRQKNRFYSYNKDSNDILIY